MFFNFFKKREKDIPKDIELQNKQTDPAKKKVHTKFNQQELVNLVNTKSIFN